MENAALRSAATCGPSRSRGCRVDLCGPASPSSSRKCGLVPALHARAASWCAANGLPETAIDHAQAAGDTDRVAQLVWKLALPAYGAGRVDTTRRWFGWFEDQGLLGRYPPVAVLGAWLQALVGEPVAAERWADAAEEGPIAGTLPDGSTVQSYLALLRALLCRNGVDRMRADAQAALDELDPGSQWRPTAHLMEGVCYLLAGQADRADPILAHAAEVAVGAGALPAAAIALAERSLVAMDHQDWSRPRLSPSKPRVWFGPGSWTAMSPAPWSTPRRPGWPSTRATCQAANSSWRGPPACGRC